MLVKWSILYLLTLATHSLLELWQFQLRTLGFSPNSAFCLVEGDAFLTDEQTHSLFIAKDPL